MSISLAQSQTLTEIANLVTDFLPASFNNTTSLPIAAKNAGVEKYWSYEGGKRGSIARMFKGAYAEKPFKFLAVLKQIVDLGLVYRSKGDKTPISRDEIVQLNKLLLRLDLQIVSLNQPDFLARLPKKSDASPVQENKVEPPKSAFQKPDMRACAALRDELIAMASVPAHERGYNFEKFLNKLFEIHGMSPRKPFRNRGEQIDGSFVHRNETFLLEAKWQAPQVAVKDLYTFASKVETKASWGKGLFISESGYTADGLFAFRQGKPTSIVCMDGFDLYLLLSHGLTLEEVIDRKKRHAAETGAAFISTKELYPDL